MTTRVLLVGSGGREHALAWKLAQSPSVDELYFRPGNPGMEHLGNVIDFTPNDPRSVTDAAERVNADLVVIGPEDPLVAGVADPLRANGRAVFGPSAAAAQLEGSKSWMKDVLVAAGVPTARHATFDAAHEAAAIAFLDTLDDLYVIKTEGLAAGKGVVVTESIGEARATVKRYLSGAAFGAAGTTCVIEEGMHGPELSLFALCDGTRAELFACAQDHKRVGDGDTGPNTGGMGAFSPVGLVTSDLEAQIMEFAIEPTLRELTARGAEYRGVFYCGLMLTEVGPKVVEYNVRFGDPECQIHMRRLDSDLYTHLHECAVGALRTPARFSDDAAAIVMLAADGYPATPVLGSAIEGLSEAAKHQDVVVFHSGTRRDGDSIVTNGGRVLGVTATGPDLTIARDRSYGAISEISFDGMHYRHDIGVGGLELT